MSVSESIRAEVAYNAKTTLVHRAVCLLTPQLWLVAYPRRHGQAELAWVIWSSRPTTSA